MAVDTTTNDGSGTGASSSNKGNDIRITLSGNTWACNGVDGERMVYIDRGAILICTGNKSDIESGKTEWVMISNDSSITNPVNGSNYIKSSDTSTIRGKWIKLTRDNGKKNYSEITESNVTNSNESSESIDSIFELSDNMISSYSILASSEEAYNEQISEGLRITDLVGIHGIPHQFLPNTDPRIEEGQDVSDFGRKYAEKIVQPIPLLLLTPGTPEFMSGFSKSKKNSMISKFLDNMSDAEFELLTNNHAGKFYSLKYDYTEYYYYVNAMLRSAAYFLEIQDETLYGKPLKTFNWLYDLDSANDKNSDVLGNSGLFKYLGPYAGCVPFYVNAGTDVSDSFGNSTGESSLAGTMNGISDKGRELNFLMGSIASAANAGALYDKVMNDGLNDNLENISDSIGGILGKNNIVSNIISNAGTLMSGGRMIFPEIWNDSSFSRSYSCSMKLVSPSGDKLSIFLNILVPIYHLMAFVLPRQSTGQAYYSPFLVRGYCKSLFNVDMGILTDLSITKGAEGEWTIDGLPTVVDVSFTIKDLYDGMMMSSGQDSGDMSIMSNITELDYIANSCGINVNEPEIIRNLKMYFTLGFATNIGDKITIGIFNKAAQSLNTKIQKIFGVF